MEGNLHVKIDWASLIVGRNFAFEGNFQAPQGVYIWRGDLTEVFLHYKFGGAYVWRGYTWRGLFSEFYGMFCTAD